MKALLTSNAIVRALRAGPAHTRIGQTDLRGLFMPLGSVVPVKIGIADVSGRVLLRGRESSVMTTKLAGLFSSRGSTSWTKTGSTPEIGRFNLLGRNTTTKLFVSSGQGRALFRGSTSAVQVANLLEPTWIAPIPNPSQFNSGTSGTFNFAPLVQNFDSTRHFYFVSVGSLPAHMSIDPLNGFVYTASGGDDSGSATVSIDIGSKTDPRGRAIFRGSNTATHVGAAIDPVADFAARTAGFSVGNTTGVFYKENFNYASLAAAAAHATNPYYYGAQPRLGPGAPDPSIFEIRDYVGAGATSGRALRINFPALSGQAGRTWLATFDPNSGEQVPFAGVQHQTFYVQVVLDGHVNADFPFKDDGSAGYGAMGSPKFFNIDRHDSSTNPGEVVCTNLGMQGKVTVYRLNYLSGHFNILWRQQSSHNNGSDWVFQNAVNTGSPPSPANQSQDRGRWGHFNSDNISIATGSITGSSTMSALGVPRSDEAGENWNPPTTEKRKVVTIFIDRPGDRIKYWVSTYGQAPVLMGDTNLDNESGDTAFTAGIVGRNASGAGGSGTGYPGFQLTLFLTKNIDAGGAAQPTTYCDYLEIIASNAPINHPGGFTLP